MAPRAGRLVQELAHVGGAHVEVGRPLGPGLEERVAFRAEGLAQLVPHLVAAGPDAGAERGHEVPRPRALARRAPRTARRGTPAAVPRQPACAAATSRLLRVHEEHGQAVGGLDAEEPARAPWRPRRRPPASRPTAPRRRSRRGPASGGAAGRAPRGSRHAGAPSRPASRDRRRRPAARSRGRAGDGEERGHGRGAQRHRGHASSGRGLHYDGGTSIEADAEDGVVASGVEIVAVEEAERLLAAGGEAVFSDGELRYARERVDPRAPPRRAARGQAGRVPAAGAGAVEREIEVVRGDYGPPRSACREPPGSGSRRSAPRARS